MASTRIDTQKQKAMDEMSKFVDDFYFPLSGLPPMSVFAGAFGRINSFDDSAEQNVNEFESATRQLANLNISAPQNVVIPVDVTAPQNVGIPQTPPVRSNNDSVTDTFIPKKKVLRSPAQPDYCVFCKNNGESELTYRSHQTKDKRNRVKCPRLRLYVCKICGESGDNAHTTLHCPERKFFEPTGMAPRAIISTHQL